MSRPSLFSPEVRVLFAKGIREARLLAGDSQAQVAKALGLRSDTQIAHWESGRVPVPRHAYEALCARYPVLRRFDRDANPQMPAREAPLPDFLRSPAGAPATPVSADADHATIALFDKMGKTFREDAALARDDARRNEAEGDDTWSYFDGFAAGVAYCAMKTAMTVRQAKKGTS